MTAGWFRLAVDKCYVAGLARCSRLSGAAIEGKVTLDAGVIRDRRGVPVGRIRDTLTIAARKRGRPCGQAVLYQTGSRCRRAGFR